jgi:hypothetical protein
MDLAQPELRPLMNLRYKHGFEWLRIYGEPRGILQAGAGVSSEDSLSNAAVSSQSRRAGACLTTQLTCRLEHASYRGMGAFTIAGRPHWQGQS